MKLSSFIYTEIIQSSLTTIVQNPQYFVSGRVFSPHVTISQCFFKIPFRIFWGKINHWNGREKVLKKNCDRVEGGLVLMAVVAKERSNENSRFNTFMFFILIYWQLIIKKPPTNPNMQSSALSTQATFPHIFI